MKRVELILKYSVFAIISIFANIFIQELTITLTQNLPFSLYISLGTGTIAGMLLKYFLDKRYIFFQTSKDIQDNLLMFAKYSFFAIFTTLIFWSFELGSFYLFKSSFTKYCGAVIGLSIGYFTKYQLDKKFVFDAK